MKLLIAIPALNEEESIDAIIRRSLEAREFICAHSPVTEVAITVVSDGSTDRTVERASRHGDLIDLIVFPKNKGYGAAIKEAWRRSDARSAGVPGCRRNLRTQVLRHTVRNRSLPERRRRAWLPAE